jgi:DNA-binding CsgD family transcriptional regulator
MRTFVCLWPRLTSSAGELSARTVALPSSEFNPDHDCDPGRPRPAELLIGQTRKREPAPARAHVRTSAGRWLALDAARMIGDHYGQVSVVISPAQPAEPALFVLRAYGLSAREREVARLVMLGHTTPQIAAALFISPNTIQDHLKSIFEKSACAAAKNL